MERRETRVNGAAYATAAFLTQFGCASQADNEYNRKEKSELHVLILKTGGLCRGAFSCLLQVKTGVLIVIPSPNPTG